MTARELEALQEVLAAEHAVVYGYGVAGARLAGAARTAATTGWESHRASRDDLSTLVTRLGGEPAAGAATYALPSPVGTAEHARALLVLLEERLAAVWADAVTALRGDLRDVAVTGLARAAASAARWRGTSVAFPGLPERTVD